MSPNLISVIIPVYNVLPYLERCVNSVLNQTYSNLDIILVDDGSTDGSGHLCDFFAQKDKRISVFHQENKGLSAARNRGIEMALGSFLYFLDSDDWIESDLLERMLNLSIQYNADISSCRSRNTCGGDVPITNNGNEVIKELYLDDIIIGLINQEVVRYEVWDKLWKKSLVSDVRFVEGQVAEDVHFDRILFLKANKIVSTNAILHNYLINRPGNTKTTFKIKRLCIFEEFKCFVNDLLNANRLDLAEAISCSCCRLAISMYCEAKRKSQAKDVLNKIKREYKRFYDYAKKYKPYNKLKLKLFRLFPNLSYLIAELHNRKKIKQCVRKQ